MSDNLIKRHGVWHFQRRVPVDFVGFDPRDIVRQSTKIRIIDDPKAVRAKQVAEKQNRALEAYWRGLLAGNQTEAEGAYAAARRRAKTWGLEFVPIAELAEAALTKDLLARLEVLRTPRAGPQDVAAVLGGCRPA